MVPCYQDNRDKECITNSQCGDLPAHCLSCNLNESCEYGRTYNVTCTANADCIVSTDLLSILSIILPFWRFFFYFNFFYLDFQGEKVLEKTMVCRYCYQTDHWEHTCTQKANCNSVASPKAYYRWDVFWFLNPTLSLEICILILDCQIYVAEQAALWKTVSCVSGEESSLKTYPVIGLVVIVGVLLWLLVLH